MDGDPIKDNENTNLSQRQKRERKVDNTKEKAKAAAITAAAQARAATGAAAQAETAAQADATIEAEAAAEAAETAAGEAAAEAEAAADAKASAEAAEAEAASAPAGPLVANRPYNPLASLDTPLHPEVAAAAIEAQAADPVGNEDQTSKKLLLCDECDKEMLAEVVTTTTPCGVNLNCCSVDCYYLAAKKVNDRTSKALRAAVVAAPAASAAARSGFPDEFE